MQIAIMTEAWNLESLQDYWSHYKEIQVAETFSFQGEESSTQPLQEFILTLRSKRVQLVDLYTLDMNKEKVLHALIDEEISVLTSYPIAETEAATQSILQKAIKNGVKVINRDTVHFLPERRQAQLEVQKGALGNPGVQRFSVRKKSTHSFDRLAIGQFEWILETFGAVKRVMAKQVRKDLTDEQSIEYHSISLRLENDSFVLLDLCLIDSKEMQSFELTGNKGMLSFHSEDASPIRVFHMGEVNDSREDVNRELSYLALAISKEQIVSYQSESMLHALRILEAAEESVRLSQPIEVRGE